MRRIINFHRIFGLAGVPKSENEQVQRIGRFFEYMMLVVAFILAIQWHLELEWKLTPLQSHILNSLVWFFFLVKAMLLGRFVKHKVEYFITNWAIIGFILFGLPVLWNYTPVLQVLWHMRLVLVLWLLMPWLDDCKRTLSDNKLGKTILTALVIMIMAGVLISGIDPAIKTPLEGIWWAWVTATTVGYGDVVPVSGIGRIFAAVLILMGLGLFAAFTANFSALFIKRGVREGVEEMKRESRDIRKVLKTIKELQKDEQNLHKAVEAMNQRLAQVEDKLK